MNLFRVGLFIAFLNSLFLVQPAWAYLDPGSGSMIMQLLLGGVAGITMVLKLYWQRIKEALFSKKSELNPDSKEVSKE